MAKNKLLYRDEQLQIFCISMTKSFENKISANIFRPCNSGKKWDEMKNIASMCVSIFLRYFCCSSAKAFLLCATYFKMENDSGDPLQPPPWWPVRKGLKICRRPGYCKYYLGTRSHTSTRDANFTYRVFPKNPDFDCYRWIFSSAKIARFSSEYYWLYFKYDLLAKSGAHFYGQMLILEKN